MKSAILSFISMFLLPIILLRGISAPIEDIPKNDALITEGEVTVTSIEELKRYNDAGLVDEYLYDDLYRFLVDGWEFSEVNDDVEISDYSITFSLPFDNMEGFDFYFTVSKSGLSTLPVGEYHKQVMTGAYDTLFYDVDVATEEKYKDVPEVKKLRHFIGGSYIWNIPTYGEGTTYPGVFDYIYIAYGENVDTGLKLDYDELCRIAKELFGVERPELLVPVGNILWTGALWPFDSYLGYQYDVVDVTKDDDGTKVILQFYADFYKFILSHKVEYSFGDDGKWLGCKVLEEGKYQPHGLEYAEDDGIIRVEWPYNLRYFVDLGVFDKEQCDFYLDFLEEHRDKYYIGNYTISFDPNQNDELPFESYIDFEVARSNDDTLPVGEYHRKLVSGDVLSFEDVDVEEKRESAVVEHALDLAKYFRENVTCAAELADNSHLYEFLVNSVYALHKDEIISLEDVSEKDYYQEFLIPNDYMKKAAALLLGIESDLPEKFYTEADFGYKKDADVFRYSPFSPPTFNTVCKNVTQPDDGVFAVTVEISNVDGGDAYEMVYTFITVTDADWGEMYQLVSIGIEPDTGVIAFLEIDQFMDTFVRFFHDEYTYGGELKGNVLYAMSLLCVNAAYNEKPTFSILENVGDPFGTIKQSDLEHVTEMILGSNVDLTKYHTTFSGNYDGYFPEEKAYRFTYGRDTWNDDPCGIDYSSVRITETDDSLVYTATVDLYEMWGSDIIAETKNLTYTFEKNVSDGLMYYKLISIKEN